MNKDGKRMGTQQECAAGVGNQPLSGASAELSGAIAEADVRTTLKTENRQSRAGEVQDAVGAMLVFKRVFEGSDGSFIYVLDESRCAATNLSGVGFINKSKGAPRWLLGDENSLIRRCLLLSFGGGFHYDLTSHRHHRVDDGVQAVYMLHAAEGVLVKFLSWAALDAFDGMEADLQHYAEKYVLDAAG